jgi:hypothetical protein
MFAARADQENTIHAHQQAAASKPLNQTAHKTPFKIPLNDENATEQLGKTGGLKTNGKGNIDLTVGKNGRGKLDKSAFVTPAGVQTTQCICWITQLISARTS